MQSRNNMKRYLVFSVITLTVVSTTYGHPVSANVPECRDGEEWVNQECRNINKNVIVVPPNCAPGQVLINGQCRDIWRHGINPQNVIEVPDNCGPNQKLINGKCRDIWRYIVNVQNIINVPDNCPPGQQLINGSCRDIWFRSVDVQNVVTVPQNCPVGQEWINGQCRDVWPRTPPTVAKEDGGDTIFTSTNGEKIIGPQETLHDLINEHWKINSLNEHTVGVGDIKIKNVINVPNQCPSGFRPDAHGICRPIWTA